MKTVSQKFKEALAAPSTEIVREVYFKRRYWVDSTKIYVWETNWTRVPEYEVVNLAAITGKLDTDKLNEFRVSNLNLVLKDDDHRWKSDNRSGRFAQDAGSPVHGYEPFWTKFQIRLGFRLSDGTVESVTVFTGLAVEFTSDTLNDQIQITIHGLETLLQNADAENVSNTVIEESLGTGNGVTTAFATLNPGVGLIDEVSLNGITQSPGKDYDVSNLNAPTSGATITFGVPPASGIVVRATYRIWKQNQFVENLVKDLLTEAGIPIASQNVDTVIFPNIPTLNFTIDTQGQWAAGLKSGVTTDQSPGDLIPDFLNLVDDFNGPVLTGWSITDPGGATLVAGRVRLAPTSPLGGTFTFNAMSRVNPTAGVVGVWESKFKLNAAIPFQNNNRIDFQISSDHTVRLFDRGGNFGDINITQGNIVIATAFNFNYGQTEHVLRIERYANGLVKVFFDGGFAVSAVTSPPAFGVSVYGYVVTAESTAWTVDFDDMKIPRNPLNASYESQVFDTVSVIQWGQVSVSQDLNGGQVTYSTAVGNDGLSFDPYVPLGANNQVLSALKRFIKIKAEFPFLATLENGFPLVHSIVIPFKANATLVTLANFTDKTVFDAIKALGQMSNYEWGFKEDETFYFRSRVVDTGIDEVLSYDKNILDITQFQNGYDRIFSEVKAEYGAFSTTVKDDGKNPLTPGSRFAKRRLSISGGDILIKEDVDIATGTAIAFFNYYGKQRRRFKVKTKVIPWLDVSDTVRVDFFDNESPKKWHHGDTNVYLGQTDIHHWGGSDQMANELVCKVLGFRHEYENKVSEFELEEVVS